MNVKGLFTDESAVSPVIGVVLMVAITVLLAATAATFFFGIGQENSRSTPQAATSFDYTQDTEPLASGSGTYRVDSLKIKHDGGDTLTARNIEVDVSGAATTTDSGGSSALDARYKWHEFASVGGPESSVSSGNSVSLEGGTKPLDGSSQDGLNLDGATVEIVWDDPSSTSSFTLNSWED